MKPESILIYLLLKKLEISFNYETKADKMYYQTMVYMLQRCGVNMGYHFLWHISPYSMDLAHVLFDLDYSLKQYEKDYTWYKLDDEVEELTNGLEKYRAISEIPDGVLITDTSKPQNAVWLEFVASVDYLHNSPLRPTAIKEEDIRAFTQKEKGTMFGNFEQSYEIALNVINGANLTDADIVNYGKYDY